MKNTFRNSVLRKCDIKRLILVIPFGLVLFITGLIRLQAQTVTDIDNNVYNTVTIGTQVWMKENLKTTKYLNGDLIGTTTPATLDISLETTPKYQWSYDGDENNVPTYGRLYTWYSVTDSRNVCPTGWHVPTDVEWTALTDYLTNNGYGYQGGIYIGKSLASKSGWAFDPTAGNVGNDQTSNNSSGFTALPGGVHNIYGLYYYIGNYGFWWSSTEYSSPNGYIRYIYYNNSNVSKGNGAKGFGYSVRCLRDQLATDITNPSISTIEVYPNPVSGILNIDYKGENFETVSIINAQGSLMIKEKSISPIQHLDFSEYVPGLYFLEFTKLTGEVKRLKVVKR